MAELFSWVPLPYCSPPGCPFPIKSLALSAHVSPRTIHFWVLDKSPVLGPGRSLPSWNRTIFKSGIVILEIIFLCYDRNFNEDYSFNSLFHWIAQNKCWGLLNSFINSEKWKWSRSVVSDSSRPHVLYVAQQAPLSMGFSRQEYWSEVQLPSP